MNNEKKAKKEKTYTRDGKVYMLFLLFMGCVIGLMSFINNGVLIEGADVTGGTPFTETQYTHDAQFGDCTIRHGIDVSKWQTNVNWQAAKAAGVEFAFIRVGNRGYGDSGVISKDGYYEKNMEGALAAGIEVGVYFFSQAITEEEAIEEAQYILDRIKEYTVTMPLVMDYEYSPSSTTGRLAEAKHSKQEATDICMAFCETIEAAGYTPMLYANLTMLNNSLNADEISAKYPIWLARYNTYAGYDGKYTFWQYSSSPVVTWVNTSLATGVGSGAKVDCNFWYYKESDPFLTGAKKNTPAPTKSPDIAVASISLSDCKLSGVQAKYTYTGKKIKVEPTLKYKKQELEVQKDYTITYQNNKKVGTATLVIKGEGDYSGTIQKTFKIVPEAPDNLHVRAKTAKSVSLQWDRDKTCTGYIIYRSTGSGNIKKIKTIKKNSTTKWTDTGLKKKTTYFYYIQSYKLIDDVKYISYYAEGDLKAETLKK